MATPLHFGPTRDSIAAPPPVVPRREGGQRRRGCVPCRTVAVTVLSGAFAWPLQGQVPSTPKAVMGVQTGTLIVEPKSELYGVTYRLPNIMTCIGSASDPKAHGVKWTGIDGRVTHTGVPLGTQVYVTVAGAGKQGFGTLQGRRINYVLKSSGLTLAVDLLRSGQPGPSCETAIGMEPAPIPSKAMPQEETAVPRLDGTLKASPSAAVNNPSIMLYTLAGAPNRLEVAGVPTHWRVTTSATPPAASASGWSNVTIDGWGLIRAANVSLINQGKQTLYLWLKNALGVSTGAAVEVSYVDVRPCTFTWRRWDGHPSLGGSKSTTEAFSVARGSSKGFAGDGMNLTAWTNTGPHAVVMGYTVGELNSTNQQQGFKTDSLPPGKASGPNSTHPFGHAKHATCH